MTPMYIYTRYMPNQHVIVDPPSTFKPLTELADMWGGDLQSLMRLCNVSAVEKLPQIWRTIAPLSRDRARAAMGEAHQRTAKHMHLSVPIINHGVTVMVLDLAFYTKYRDSVGDAINIFIFPDVSPEAGSKAALLACCWVTFL